MQVYRCDKCGAVEQSRTAVPQGWTLLNVGTVPYRIRAFSLALCKTCGLQVGIDVNKTIKNEDEVADVLRSFIIECCGDEFGL